MAQAIMPLPISDAPAAPTSTFSLSFTLYNGIGAGLAAYHGYKRNRSIGWALAWAACGAMAPIITNAIGLAQGFAKPKNALITTGVPTP